MYDETYFKAIDKDSSYRPKLQKLIACVKAHNPKLVLDVGCGRGYLVRELRKLGMDARGTDISPFAGDLIPEHFKLADATKQLPYLDQKFDVVISSDFFEHLDNEEIDGALAEMKRVGRVILALVCFKKEKVANTHKTVKPKEWWEEKLSGVELLNR